MNDAPSQHESALNPGKGHEMSHPATEKPPAKAPCAPVMPPLPQRKHQSAGFCGCPAGQACRAMMPTARDQQNQTAPDQSNNAPRPALLFGKLIESIIEAAVYTHPRTGLITIDVPIAISKSGCSLFTHSVHSEEDQSRPDGSEREQVQKTERFME